MGVDASLWGYFANAGWMVKGVMMLLVGSSIVSWAYIFQQASVLRRARLAAEQFDRKFWAGGDLAALYEKSIQQKHQPEGTEAFFQAGFREFLKTQKVAQGIPEKQITSAERAMHRMRLHEEERLEMRLPFLATVGSVAPFVGIFGTVCGIMLTFRTLATVQQATISMVAPGIAEALIATAMGLFAAIPAVVAYNRFTTEVNRLLNRFDMFQEAFLTILHRQAHTA